MDKIFSDSANIYFFGLRRFLKPDFLSYLFHNNLIVEGVRGGLILGNFHSEGGIPVIQESKPNEYEILFEFEGFEYLMNALLTMDEINIVEKINKAHLTKDINRYIPPNGTNIIDARGNAVILIGKVAQFVVNKNATLQNLKFLDDLNKKTWEERVNK